MPLPRQVAEELGGQLGQSLHEGVVADTRGGVPGPCDIDAGFVDLTGELLDNDECFFDDDNDNEYNRVVWFSPAAIPAITAELRCFELDE